MVLCQKLPPRGEGPQTMTQYIALEKFMAHSGMHDADK